MQLSLSGVCACWLKVVKQCHAGGTKGTSSLPLIAPEAFGLHQNKQQFSVVKIFHFSSGTVSHLALVDMAHIQYGPSPFHIVS